MAEKLLETAREDIYKLPKKQLVKTCKKLQIPSNGSKWDLVLTIVNKLNEWMKN